MTLTAIPEEKPCRVADTRISRLDKRPQDVDQIAMTIKRTFIELVVKPCRFPRQRSFTDSELLCGLDATFAAEHSDASTATPSDEEDTVGERKPLQEPAEWSSPAWGPADDLFYSSQTFFPLPPADAISGDGQDWSATAAYGTWGMQPWAMTNWGSSEQYEQWSNPPAVDEAMTALVKSAMGIGATDSGPTVAQSSEKAAETWADQSSPCQAADTSMTTIMLRNFPKQYTRSDLIKLLEDEGFEGSYDLVYVPMDFSSECCLGYGFVNFMTGSDAARCWTAFDGFSEWGVESGDACEVVWSNPHQGIEALIDRYRNSPVMHDSVPDEWKPSYFVDGVQTLFPVPTEKIKAPKQKHTRGKGKKAKC